MTGMQQLRRCLPMLILSLNRPSITYPVFQPLETDANEPALDYQGEWTGRQQTLVPLQPDEQGMG